MVQVSFFLVKFHYPVSCKILLGKNNQLRFSLSNQPLEVAKAQLQKKLPIVIASSTSQPLVQPMHARASSVLQRNLVKVCNLLIQSGTTHFHG